MGGFHVQLYRPGDEKVADLLMEQGRIAAQRAAASGQIWGNALQNVGQNVGQTIADAPKRRLEESKARREEASAARQEAQLAQQAGDQSALDKAYAQPGVDPAAIEQSLRDSGRAHLIPAFRDSWNKQQEQTAKYEKAVTEAHAAQSDMLANGARYLKNHVTDPDGGIAAATTWVQTLPKNLQQAAGPYMQQVQQNPGALPKILDDLINQSPSEQARIQKEQDKETKLGPGDILIRNGKTVAENPKESKVGTEEDFVRKQFGPNPTAAQVLQARRQWAAAGEQDAAPSLTPAGMDMAALQFRKTGQLPPMGMGKAGATVRQAILNRAATMTPEDIAKVEAGGLDVASNKANFTADSQSLRKLQSQSDAVNAFEETAKKNIDIFLNEAGKVVDTGSPIANRLARHVTGHMLGSKDQASYDAARQVALNEVAKIVSNPNLSGTLSDSARREVEAFNPREATLAQSVAVMRLLKRDMANRKQSYTDQIGAIRERMGGKKETPKSADPLGIR